MTDLQSCFFGFVLVGLLVFFVIGLIDDLSAASALAQANMSDDNFSLVLDSLYDFYSELFYFIFKSKNVQLLYSRKDSSQEMNSQIFENFIRTDNSNLFRNVTVPSNSVNIVDFTSGYILLKSSSLLTVNTMSHLERELTYREERARIERRKMQIISERFIFGNTVFEIIAINKDVIQDVAEVINRISVFEQPSSYFFLTNSGILPPVHPNLWLKKKEH